MRVSLREIRQLVRSALRESGSDPRALAKDVLLKGDREAFIVLQDAMEESDQPGAGAALRDGSILTKLKVLTNLASIPFPKSFRRYHLSYPLDCFFEENKSGNIHVTFTSTGVFIFMVLDQRANCLAGRVVMEYPDHFEPVAGLNMLVYTLDLFSNGNLGVTGLNDSITIDNEDPRYQEVRKQFDEHFVPFKNELLKFLSVFS